MLDLKKTRIDCLPEVSRHVDSIRRATEGYRELALFAGSGGSLCASAMLGWRTVCAVEINRSNRDKLVRLQEHGYIHPFPIWDDITTFDPEPWKGCIDVITGGFPCQDFSTLSPKIIGGQTGLAGSRSGLFYEMLRVVGSIMPKLAVFENVSAAVSAIDTIYDGIRSVGYSAAGSVFNATEAGLHQLRPRLYIVATPADSNI